MLRLGDSFEVATASEADAKGAGPEFRWPARGRIIQGFKSGGNDGINISVPEGTSVRAAESGMVAYAGSALKGYGNLVLIRHPNGFVSAYANNGELDVKRGETVKRGQVIAKSGESGNVSAPQLHFELRESPAAGRSHQLPRRDLRILSLSSPNWMRRRVTRRRRTARAGPKKGPPSFVLSDFNFKRRRFARGRELREPLRRLATAIDRRRVAS